MESNLLKSKKVLVVDDEKDVLDSLEELLSMCEVVKADNFQDAKEYLENNSFDIAILDIMGVNGYELLEIANKKGVMAVMLTAHALSPESVVKSYENGASYYIPKDEIGNIESYLKDILVSKKEGKDTWWKWYDRFSNLFEEKFGSDWKKNDEEFWKRFLLY